VSEKGNILLILVIGVLAVVVVGLIFLNLGSSTRNEKQLEPSFIFAPTANETFSNAEKLKQVAQKTDTATIKDCKLEPEVIQISRGESLKIKNQDNLERTIALTGSETTIQAGEAVELDGNTFDFLLKVVAATNANPKEAIPIFPVACGGSEKLAGYIIVANQ